MMRTDNEMTPEWSPAEQTRLDELARERRPSAGAEAATIASLRARRLLRVPLRKRIPRIAAIAAAAVIVFAMGVLAGYRASERRTVLAAIDLARSGVSPFAESVVAIKGPNRKQVVWY
jgi:hypothetical protein